MYGLEGGIVLEFAIIYRTSCSASHTPPYTRWSQWSLHVVYVAG